MRLIFGELHVSWRVGGYLKVQDLPFLANRKVTLPFGVKEQGHEDMDVIPQVQERPDSFLLSCCERRVKCHSAPNLCFPLRKPGKIWREEGPTELFSHRCHR